jgi:outer membrane immunogenic protein
MRKVLLATVALAALGSATSASAADLAARPYIKAPPLVVAAYDWSGFYIGANAGYGTSRKCWDYAGFAAARLVSNVADGCHDADGAVAGGQIGYNWQAGSWVFGLEAQGDWADLKGSQNSTLFADVNRSKVEAFGLFTGRIGYAWNNTLLYVKGGAAVVSDKYDIRLFSGTVISNASETRWGGAVGVGIEYGFTPNWTFGVEYNHAFLERADNTFTGPLVLPTVDSIHQDLDIITARINYKWGGPVVARY